MGTQQILLIVLSVIIVGIAVAVGITMFNQQSINSARVAVIGDMNNFATQAIAWWKTPVSMGGAGRGGVAGDVTLARLSAHLGATSAGVITNDNGVYTFALTAAGALTITVVPNEGNLTPAPQGDIALATENAITITYPVAGS